MKRADVQASHHQHHHDAPGKFSIPHIICLVILSVLPFISSLSGDFVFDDIESVTNNPIVTGDVPLNQIFSRDFWGRRHVASPNSHKSFRPVTTFTFWLNWKIHGNSTFGYHLVNIILHLLVVLQLYFCMKLWQKGNSSSIAFPTALSFAIHPVHSEAIANITGRAELLSAYFGLLALYVFSKKIDEMGQTSVSSIVYTILIGLSLFSKEQGISILIVSLFIGLAYRKQKVKPIGVQLLVTSVCFIWLRLHINNYTNPRFTQFDNAAAFLSNPVHRTLNYFYIWLYHIYLMVFPIFLCFDYSMGCIPLITSITDPKVFSVPFLLFIGLGCIFVYRNIPKEYKKLYGIAIVIGIASFLPASNLLVTVGFTVAERVLYLPSVGYSILLSIFYNILKKTGKINNLPILIVTGLAIAQCYQRGKEWSTELSLYSSGLNICPNNAKIHYNLAKVLGENGAIHQAEQNYWEAIRLNPSYEHALNNLANILEKRGQNQEAENLLRRAVQIQPSFATAWMNLGITLMKNDKLEESENCFKNSLKIRPLSADCFYNLGNLYRRMHRLEDAKSSWLNATSIYSNHVRSWTNLLIVLDELNDCDTVIALAPRALEYGGSISSIRSQLGSCYAQRGHFEKAEIEFQQAIRINNSIALYHANLGILYQKWRKMHLAELHYAKALKLDDRLTNIKQSLEVLQLQNRNSSRLH